MSTYLIQGAYSPSATSSMVKHPQDRATAVRGMIEKAGGQVAQLLARPGRVRFCRDCGDS